MATAQELKAKYGSQLIQRDNVRSVGIGLDGNGEEVLIVRVSRGVSRQNVLPQSIVDENVVVEETERFRALVAPVQEDPEDTDRKTKQRPVPMGVSTGHPNITAGTVGFIMTDGSTQYTGSNNHVYADVNGGDPGDPIYQPGPTDGGTSSDQSATLEGFVPLENGTLVDFAWAATDVEHINDLAEVGVPQGEPRRPQVGDTLVKSGRTTGVTTGTVEQVNVSVTVNYGNDQYTLEDQIFTSDMSDGGDSGSAALFQSDNAPAGVIFAGNSSTSVLNQAVNVESESGLQIVTGGGSDVPTANVNLQMTRSGPSTGNVEGQVTDSDTGEGLEGVNVNFQGDGAVAVTTDADGRFGLTDVTITTWEITATKDGYEDATATITADDFV